MSEQVWFTSDTHFHHNGILRFARGKDFADVEEMNEVLIESWTKSIKRGDRVYHLGDFSFGGKTKIKEIISRLTGQIYLIRGNHDGQLDSLSDLFTWYGNYKEIKVNEQRICMSHFPFLTWHQAHYGSWMLHGHSHGLLAPTTQPRLDVGVDANGYKPISFEQVSEMMKDRVYDPVDHHGSV